MKRKPGKPTPDDLVRDGLARQEAGDLAGAEPRYRQALALDADHPRALGLLAMILLERGAPGEALARITHALDGTPPAAPEAAWLQLERGHALAALDRDAEAVAAMQAAIALDRR
ncbi:MAG TPA: tetratricopeptide repeat protein, partial [Kofleriaceae bacterium]|nr:tetratricopeptide repeat protein [Kofleriaceae bacterium]